MTNTQKKKWTLMFFLASDNALSPSTLSQLKAIKAAGSQADTNVLVYFDPNEKGAPTRVFEINKENKHNAAQSSASIGDPDEPIVTVLTRDAIDPTTITGPPGSQSEQFGSSLQKIDELDACAALKNFLGFCREAYPADHYMLFLLGHGLVVGRDAFLPDDNPDSAIGLKTLGEILTKFSTDIRGQGVLELIAMHSCSMSGIEIAYELKGTANYMLASQGISFVGSWPYRQLLTKIFKAVDNNVVVPELMKSLESLCIQYSADFMYAGYSADMCLCSLQAEPIQKLTKPIQELSVALTNGLKDRRCRELIVLAHWKSQSYWQETYSDLYDFCLCLRRLCNQPKREPQDQKHQTFAKREYDIKRIAIIDACSKVIDKLRPQTGSQTDGPVVCADYIGPDCQYSHGLSIYFPWSDPVADANDHVLENYEKYTFTQEVGDAYWLKFLNSYFEDTRREDRLTEDDKYADENVTYQTNPDYMKALATARASFAAAVVINTHEFMSTSALEGKVSPPDSGGGACTCASTRNYSRVFSMSPGVSTVFGGVKPKSATATPAPAPSSPPTQPTQPAPSSPPAQPTQP